jgi:Pilus formation protein N terminal region
MRLVCLRGRSALGLIICLAVGAFSAAASAPAHAATPITVQVDRATLIKLPEQAVTVVIGNPLIADLTVEPHGLGVVTGKGYGATNFIVLDKDGVVLAEHTVEVLGPSGPTVVVYRGATRQTYSCTPDCERRFTLGDTGSDYFDGAIDKDYFSKTLEQITSRNSQAMGAGAAQPQAGQAH